jgi:hypothetical protein
VFTNGFMPDFAKLATSPVPVRDVFFDDAHPETLEQFLSHSPLWSQVQVLTVRGDSRLGSTSRFPLVRTIAERGVFPELRSLHLVWGTDDGAGDALPSSDLLRVLSHLGLVDIGIRAEAATAVIAAMPSSVMSLDLSYGYPNIGDMIEGSIDRLAQLEKLYLRDQMIQPQWSLAALAARATELREIATTLPLNWATSAPFFDGLVAGPARRLRRLEISDNNGIWADMPIDASVAAAIGRLAGVLDSVEHVEFSSHGLFDEGAIALACLPSERLDTLDLSYSNVGTAGIRALLANPRVHRVRVLRIPGCRVGEAGFEALLATPFTRLEELDVSYCDVHPDPLVERFGAAVVRSA